jgi:hypothetical protein
MKRYEKKSGDGGSRRMVVEGFSVCTASREENKTPKELKKQNSL